jgi:outer membrane lipoprotein-sorting protein
MDRLLRIAVIALAACCAFPQPTRAGDEPGTPAPQDATTAPKRPALEDMPPELQHVLRQLDKANEGLKDASADVTYEREIPLLDSKQKSRGSLVYMAPDLLILKLGKPRNEEVRTNGKFWWVVSHDDKQVEVYKAAEGDQGSQETAFLGFGYGTGSKRLLEDYDIKLISVTPPTEGDQGGETLYRLEFVPVERPDRPAKYELIEAVIGSKLWLPQTIILHEEGDEIVHTYSLRSIKLNTGVKAEVFEYTPPRGYNVVPLDDF